MMPVQESKEIEQKVAEPDMNIQDQELDPAALLKFIASKQREDSKLSKLLIQVSKGTYKAKMEAGSMTNNLRIEENGALTQQVRIRTSKITPPNELWVVFLPSALKRAVLEMFHGNESTTRAHGRVQNPQCY